MKNSAVFCVLLASLFLSVFISAISTLTTFAEEGNPPADPLPAEASNSAGNETEEIPTQDPPPQKFPEVDGEQPEAVIDENLSAVVPPEESLELPEANEPSEIVEEETLQTEGEIDSAEIVVDNDEPELVDLSDSLSTEMVILDEAGEPLPLASEEAAEILVTGDPIWCPASVAVPKPGTRGCTNPGLGNSNYDPTSLSSLLEYLEDNQAMFNKDGTIWIARDYDSLVDAGDNFVLDGNTAFAVMNDFKLNIKGGWNGCNPTCVGTIDSTNPSELNGSLQILNWNNDVTLSDLLITGVADTASNALEVETIGKITLMRVDMSDNDGSGARLDNAAGIKDISITASSSNDNAAGDGLHVTSNGLVTLKDVVAAANGGTGAYISNISLTLKGVTLLGTNVFSENQANGLEIHSSGQVNAGTLINNVNGGYGLWIDNSSSTKAVILTGAHEFKFNGGGLYILSRETLTLNNIVATNNSIHEGAYLDNSGAPAANVTLTGINIFSWNQLDGLHIFSKGAITLNNSTSNANGQGGVHGYGAWLVNSGAGLAKAIIISASTFNDNFEGGLHAISNGAITISKLVANGNEGNGAELNNSGANPLAPQNVLLIGSVVTSLNEGAGLAIQSQGSITLSSVTANGNHGNGATLNASKPVTISGSSSFNENGAIGLSITSKGSITLSNITAIKNMNQGAILNNDLVGAIGNVTINGINEFSENHDTGLEISGRASVLVANIHALGNMAKGFSIDNSVDGFQGSVTVGTKLLNWCNEVSGNTASGLEITSNGAVTLTNVCAFANGSLSSPGYGATIDNHTSTYPYPVALNGINSFSENYAGGIQISSNGKITLANLTASNNLHGFGATLNNASNVNKPQSINLLGFNQVSANYGNGLTVTTYGPILINNLSAGSNGANGGSGYGAWLDNCNWAVSYCMTIIPQSVTLTGRNSFSSNYGYGLKVLSLGTINLNNVGATSNRGAGAILNNDFGGAVGGISITGTVSDFSRNANGLEATSRRAIFVSNLVASSNVGNGATLNNYAAPPFPQGITISGYAITDDNEGSYGLSLRTWGVINISNLSASNNGAQGAILDNAEGPGATGTITLVGIQRLVDNDSSGLEITSNQAVTISNLNASLNNGYGVFIDNRAAGLQYDVKLNGSNTFSGNDLIGLNVRTLGAITLNNVTADKNGVDETEHLGHGVYLNNQTGTNLAKTITLTGVNTFNWNFEDGLHALSLGQIKANSLSATENSGNGVDLDNELGAITAGIALSGVNNFQENNGFGLITLSRGIISLANITADYNETGGANVDNSGSYSAVMVSITGINSFSHNGSEETEAAGLLLGSRGNVTLSNLTADGNTYIGAKLDNKSLSIGTPTITLTGISSFSGNENTGLFIEARGDVNLSKFVADGNTGDGLFIASVKNVALTCGSLTANEGAGVVISALTGTVTLKGVFAYGNEAGNSDVHAAKLLTTLGCPLP